MRNEKYKDFLGHRKVGCLPYDPLLIMIRWIVGGRLISDSKFMTRLKIALKIYLGFLILGLAFPALAISQIQLQTKPPIKIEAKTYPSRINAGQEVWVAVDIVLDKGWHIYGNPKGPGPGLPTILEVASVKRNGT